MKIRDFDKSVKSCWKLWKGRNHPGSRLLTTRWEASYLLRMGQKPGKKDVLRRMGQQPSKKDVFRRMGQQPSKKDVFRRMGQEPSKKDGLRRMGQKPSKINQKVIRHLRSSRKEHQVQGRSG